MSDFLFTTISGTDVVTQIPVSCGDLEEAKIEARRVLARLIGERLANDPCEMVSVEIFDATERPLTELRMMYQEIDK